MCGGAAPSNTGPQYFPLSGTPSPTDVSSSMMKTGGNDYSQSPMGSPWGQGSMPPWLAQLMATPMTGGNMQVQQPSQPIQPPTPAPLQSSDPNVQQYLNQNYMPGIHGGPDPSMLAGSMQTQQAPGDMNKVAQVQQPPNPFARTAGPPGTTNGPGGLGFTPPPQPTQLFGPTAGLFGGVTRPPGTPNNFGYFPGTQQWGAPNMGWASQWGKQPG